MKDIFNLLYNCNNQIVSLITTITLEKIMTKVSVIRFKPKPECFNEFLNNIKELNIDKANTTPPTHYLMTTADEVVAIAFRAESELSQSSAKGVNWLDTQRHLLLEYSKEDRHTIPLTGNLVEY